MSQAIERYTGRQLAIVHYAPQHHPLSVEWVYNNADIDNAPIVWAREMGPAADREIIDYFKTGRSGWWSPTAFHREYQHMSNNS